MNLLIVDVELRLDNTCIGPNTICIHYDKNDTFDIFRKSIIETIRDKQIQNINRIGFAFHGRDFPTFLAKDIPFWERKKIILSTDVSGNEYENENSTRLKSILMEKYEGIKRYDELLINGKQYSSLDQKFVKNKYKIILDPNTQVSNLISSIKTTYGITRIDFLGCDLLLYTNWVQYFAYLEQTFDVKVGASSDKTGNLQYGGNWIMESTGENLKDVYFNDSLKDYALLMYGSSPLFTSPLTDINGQAVDKTFFQDASSLTATFKMSGNMTIEYCEYYSPIVIDNSGVFDGSGFTITLSGTNLNFPGLFLVKKGTIKNLVVTSPDSINMDQAAECGWIVGYDPINFEGGGGGTNNYCIIDNCVLVNSPISYGGICGSVVGNNGGFCEIMNSGLSGTGSYFQGAYCGGICGPYAGLDYGCVYIHNCSINMTLINTNYSGGILGAYSAGLCVLENCISECNIGSDSYIGGICGAYTSSGAQGGECIIINCNYDGLMAGYCGGICGGFTCEPDSTTLTPPRCAIINCSSTGAFLGSYIGGITGPQTAGGSVSVSSGSLVLLDKCTSYHNGDAAVSPCTELIGPNSSSTINNKFITNSWAGYTIAPPIYSTDGSTGISLDSSCVETNSVSYLPLTSFPGSQFIGLDESKLQLTSYEPSGTQVCIFDISGNTLFAKIRVFLPNADRIAAYNLYDISNNFVTVLNNLLSDPALIDMDWSGNFTNPRPSSIFDTTQYSNHYQGDLSGNGSFYISEVPVCLFGETMILMADGTKKKIMHINRGDFVAGDKECRVIHQVARLMKNKIHPGFKVDIVGFGKGSIDCESPDEYTYATFNHPIIYNNCRYPAKSFKLFDNVTLYEKTTLSDLIGMDKNDTCITNILYDIQFDHEGTYIANGLKVQSRSPYSELTPLSRDLYFDIANFKKLRVWDSYNHEYPLSFDVEPK
jgi:hypothetical protein